MTITLDGTTGITTPTEKVVTTIGVGNATPSASGAGISFPATQSASTDANTLDDYEEGTWTPTIAASSGSITSYVSSGNYTKIGRLVTLNFLFNVTNIGTGTGGVTISNLPFTGVANTGTGVLREIAVNGYTGSIYFSSSSTLNAQNYNSTGIIPSNNVYWDCAISYPI